MTARHDHCWTVADAEGNEAQIVEVGTDRPYWWVLCPATATLVLTPPERPEADPCSIGMDCNFDALHHRAEAFIRSRVPSPADRSEAPDA